MKKILSACVVLVTTLTLFSCNNNETKKEETNKTDSVSTVPDTAALFKKFEKMDVDAFVRCSQTGVGIANVMVDTSVSNAWIKHFDSLYGTHSPTDHIKAFERSYWIDKCTMLSIAKYIKDSGTKYDGIRFIFGCSLSNGSYNGDNYKRKTTLSIYATKFGGNTTTTPVDKIHINDSVATIKNPCGSVFIQNHSTARKLIKEFDKIYRHRGIPSTDAPNFDSLSKSVWTDSCVIFYIADLLENSSYGLDGIYVKTAAYFDHQRELPSQSSPNQSTIIIVPTSPGNKAVPHIERPDVVRSFLEMLMFKNFKINPSTLNHGQLCPKNCPTL